MKKRFLIPILVLICMLSVTFLTGAAPESSVAFDNFNGMEITKLEGKKIYVGQKFRAWYILQHLKDYSDANGDKSFKGKPFITKVIFRRYFSGKI
ncbi:MAG: hypothetical protein IJP17_05915 [Clostridia bacterium]|nr:hypothetical protein [Clostridia bacterium]